MFKIDTGAHISEISETVFKQLKGMTLVNPDRYLSGPSQYQLQVSGKFQGRRYQSGWSGFNLTTF